MMLSRLKSGSSESIGSTSVVQLRPRTSSIPASVITLSGAWVKPAIATLNNMTAFLSLDVRGYQAEVMDRTYEAEMVSHQFP